MTAVLAVAGALVLLLLVVDMALTTLSASEGTGPVTGLSLRVTWRLLHRGHRGTAGNWFRLAGPVLLLLAVVTWFLLLWAGWSLVFLSGEAVRHATTGADAGVWQVVYYAGYSVMTLGVGDYTATGDGWRVLTVLASFNGLFVMTLSITYLLSVLSAVVQRNALALQISGLGQSPAEILAAGWDGGRFTPTFLQQLTDLGAPLALVAQQHLAYPVLAIFHSGRRDTSLPVVAATLDDAMLLLADAVAADARPADVPRSLRSTVAHLLANSAATDMGREPAVPGAPDLGPVRRAGVPLRADPVVAEAVAGAADRRRSMRRLVEHSGWSWESP